MESNHASQRLDDIAFCLAAIDPALPHGWEREAALDMLGSLARFADEVLAPTNAPADAEGCRFENGHVRMPAVLVDAYARYRELGWHQLNLPEAAGGVQAPPVVASAAVELLAGANHAFQMVTGLVPGATRILCALAQPEVRDRFVPPLVAGESLATMCLTEGAAGSDLAAIRCAATRDGDGWRLTGEKIFISGGDQDLTPRITHLVLARSGKPEEGVAGLSLFVCGSHRYDGSRNAVSPARIEHKLGLHASPTCALRFDGAEAQLVGDEGRGLEAMFLLMNEARLDVAMQGVAHAANAAMRATDYAADRVQGRVGGVPARIDAHGDVQRMLMHIDALALGGRAMVLRAASRIEDPSLAAILTPVTKVFCTEAGSTAADMAMQVLGGYGYLPEYGIEQIWRDCRVTRIYEGSNGVLSMTLVRRLLRNDTVMTAFAAELDDAVGLAVADESRRAAGEVIGEWDKARVAVLQSADPGAAAFPTMQLAGLAYFAACWLRLEAAAQRDGNGRVLARAAFVRDALLPAAVALSRQAVAFADRTAAGG